MWTKKGTDPKRNTDKRWIVATSFQQLLSRGRKAGLGTQELYGALAARRPEAGDLQQGQSDSNGFVSDVHQDGRKVYHPVQGNSRC